MNKLVSILLFLKSLLSSIRIEQLACQQAECVDRKILIVFTTWGRCKYVE